VFLWLEYLSILAIVGKVRPYKKKAPCVMYGAQSSTVVRLRPVTVHEEIIYPISDVYTLLPRTLIQA